MTIIRSDNAIKWAFGSLDADLAAQRQGRNFYDLNSNAAIIPLVLPDSKRPLLIVAAISLEDPAVGTDNEVWRRSLYVHDTYGSGNKWCPGWRGGVGGLDGLGSGVGGVGVGAGDGGHESPGEVANLRGGSGPSALMRTDNRSGISWLVLPH